MPAYIWENMREENFEEAIKESGGLCILPVGCLEMHGQHLPLNTDNLIAEVTAKLAAEVESVCVFPTFEFGDIHGLENHHGSVILSVELQQAILTELCAEIARNGFKKIMLLNAHGGNLSILKNFVRSTMHTKKDYVVLCRNAYDYGVGDLVYDIRHGVKFPHLTDADIETLFDFYDNRKRLGHACLEETSLILHIAPELVRMDRIHAANGLPTGRTAHLAPYGLTESTRFWGIEYPDSYCADHPDNATATIGRTLMDKYVERQAEACRLLKMDDRVLEWNEELNASWIG